jgi:hypothetical protein
MPPMPCDGLWVSACSRPARAGLAALLLGLAYMVLDPTPPRHVVLATGPARSDVAEFGACISSVRPAGKAHTKFCCPAVGRKRRHRHEAPTQRAVHREREAGVAECSAKPSSSPRGCWRCYAGPRRSSSITIGVLSVSAPISSADAKSLLEPVRKRAGTFKPQQLRDLRDGAVAIAQLLHRQVTARLQE